MIYSNQTTISSFIESNFVQPKLKGYKNRSRENVRQIFTSRQRLYNLSFWTTVRRIYVYKKHVLIIKITHRKMFIRLTSKKSSLVQLLHNTL